MQRIFDRLLLVAACLAFCVVVLGAFVRLSDAGLGCPDWPGCYGHMTVPHGEVAQLAYPDKPLVAHKAWKEMVHRYLAGTLGLLIISICVLAWRGRGVLANSPLLPTLLLALVLFQAALGMWTVTLLLKPVIVSLHLLGGMATLGLLVWLVSGRLYPAAGFASNLRPWALCGLLLLFVQIALGGWTSSNYAALACPDFPVCQGVWWPQVNFSSGFHFFRELGVNPDGTELTLASLTAIHIVHRIGALITFLYLIWFGFRLINEPGMRVLAYLLFGLVVFQVGLGISNVLFSLPLPVAVAHNAGAAMLLVHMVVINSALQKGGKQ